MRKKELTIGTWVSLNDSDVPELLSRIGFDWLVFDTEHAPLTIQDVQKLIKSTNGTETSPLVRVTWNDPVLVKRALDIGVEGVVVPWVNNREDAMKAVQACRYPPRGIRGYGPRRAAVYGLDRTYAKRADDEIAVVVQIETEEAVRNIEDILSVEGIDAFFVGPWDLSQSLGIPGDLESERFKSVIDSILRAASGSDKTAGIWTDNPEAARKRIKQGFKMIALSGDMQMLLSAAREWLDTVRTAG